tara:strand:- start:5291 stop:5563 length:273 start_codon:yes stop_codon:yes gene_type:complete
MTKQQKILGPDGYERSKKDNELLNDLLTTTFGTPHGIETLKYLKSITTERVAGPEIKADALFHLEGQRFLVGVIETRIRQHQATQEQTNE